MKAEMKRVKRVGWVIEGTDNLPLHCSTVFVRKYAAEFALKRSGIWDKDAHLVPLYVEVRDES